jgi:hypothetical protein
MSCCTGKDGLKENWLEVGSPEEGVFAFQLRDEVPSYAEMFEI